MEECEICGISGNEVRLFDAICEGRMGQVCERCSLVENIPIIKKPDSKQLKESEKGAGVYDRMKRISGIKDGRKEDTFFPEDRLKELEKNPELERPEKAKLNLIEHFHWEIMKNRRRKGLSQAKLSEILGESEVAIQMIEKGKLPENADVLIRKLEQFFQVRFRKLSETELFQMRQKKMVREKPVLLDGSGKELETIPEPEIKKYEPEEIEEETADDLIDKSSGIDDESDNLEDKKTGAECRVEEFDDSKKKMTCEQVSVEREQIGDDMPVKDFDLKRVNLSSLTINDLKRLHKKRVEATRQEQIEEQKKIEERQRLIEARKEELRLRKQRQSEELNKRLGGSELFKRKDYELEEPKEELE